MKTACIQLNVSDSPDQNLSTSINLIQNAAACGAQLVATPECTNLIAGSTKHLKNSIVPENQDETLATFRKLAGSLKIWLLIGSLSIKNPDSNGPPALNRQFLINTKGEIIARYDKIHMFDVDVNDGQTYRESDQYAAGKQVVTSEINTEFRLGHSICYDARFAYLYALLAQKGANVLAIPAAFTYTTGKAHWHTLLRARAIETGSWVLAPAQCGFHAKGRQTYGHSLIITPWGKVVSQASENRPGIILADITADKIIAARDSIPTLRHHRQLIV